MDETLLERIFRALHREGVRYVVFGGTLGRALSGHRFPPGVHRSRSIEEHARLRERWEAQSHPGSERR